MGPNLITQGWWLVRVIDFALNKFARQTSLSTAKSWNEAMFKYIGAVCVYLLPFLSLPNDTMCRSLSNPFINNSPLAILIASRFLHRVALSCYRIWIFSDLFVRFIEF